MRYGQIHTPSLFKALVLLILLAQVALVRAEGSKVYLLGNITIRGTPVTLSVLLHERKITDLADCEAFLQKNARGSVADQQLYRHHIRQQKAGITLKPYYRCIESEQDISRWDSRGFYKYIYLVDMRNGLSFTRFEDTNSCWAAMRNESDKHSESLFCTKMNQTISGA
ncbi:hypothetical protein [Aliamphritea ceti]|uniref:hypothetical protein n=1 Tax=Aliamphritea ceti TaxID=1524258 RepID=UPI0021C317E6|nr:hypothetical protein [Aliamphritea ceti]